MRVALEVSVDNVRIQFPEEARNRFDRFYAWPDSAIRETESFYFIFLTPRKDRAAIVPPRPSSTSPGCAPTASTRTKEVETQSKILRCPLLGQSVLFCGFSILRIYCVSNAWFAKFLLKFLRVSNYIRYKCVSRYKTLLIEDYDAYTFFAFSI